MPLLPDFEADAYTRMQIAEHIADTLRHGQPLVQALYNPVWPPAWQALCALAELVWPDPYYAPKALSAIFGGLTPLLAFALARRLWPKQRVAWLAWALVALAPLHVAYSTSGMSEASYGFWFLLAALLLLYAERDNAWLVGAAAALLPAALMRFDCWFLLLVLVPLALWQRRATPLVAAASLAVLAAGPLSWFALNWRMAGHPLAFLGTHHDYLAHFYQTYKFRQLFGDRGPLGLAFHVCAVVFTMGAAVTVWGVRSAAAARGRDARALAAWLLMAFLYLFVLWLLRRQVGWRRHYLAIGCGLAPFAAAGLLAARRRLVVAVLCLDLAVLLPSSAALAYVPRRYVQVADFLRLQEGRIYCDEPGVRILSRLPLSRFVATAAPRGGRAQTLAWLREQSVRWVVYTEVDYSPLPEAFPGLPDQDPLLRLAFVPPANRWLQRLLVYELPPQ